MKVWTQISFCVDKEISVCAGHLRQERPPHLHPDVLHPALRERGRAILQSHIVPRVVEKDGRVSHLGTLSSCRLISVILVYSVTALASSLCVCLPCARHETHSGGSK
jgi:hypothetical protein